MEPSLRDDFTVCRADKRVQFPVEYNPEFLCAALFGKQRLYLGICPR